ncbi:hydrogenase nickel incorporation protein HypB [bacterium BFN5]|nr:hydrogenase nickel incorporation protein HypB [bacterium BFN5]
MEIKVMANILEVNDQFAAQVNARLNEHGVFAINLMGSPGCGKTLLLEKTIAELKNELNIAIIEGDLYTHKDAQRIKQPGVQVFQINTVGGCHLDANMVNIALDHLELTGLDLLIIENVGNLVCPAEFNLGEQACVTVLSITEGEDKPQKYPLVFLKAQAVLINKIDLLSFTDFNLESASNDLAAINSAAELITVSCRTGEGLNHWYDWLRKRAKKQARC